MEDPLVEHAFKPDIELQSLLYDFTMPFSSPHPTLAIPKVDLLSYLFPLGVEPSDTPIWIDSSNPNESLSPRQLLQWVKRLALGLDRLGVKEGDVVMIHTPNHIFVPVAYLGIVGSRRVFSGANPAYTVSGEHRTIIWRGRQS